jgi:epoxide hydrolase 4
MLLHGFPEFWYAWRHQIPALVDAGYRVVAPDLPGYNTSDKPPRVRDYRPSVLATEGGRPDRGLGRRLGRGRRARLGRRAGLAAGHAPPRARRAAGGGPGFPGAAPGPGSPAVPAACLHRPGHRPLRGRGRPAGCPAGRRQLLPGRLPRQPAGAGTQPASGGHPDSGHLGDQDRYLGRELAEPDRAWVPEVRVERITEASHWVQADAPERVNQLMVDFLQPIGG